MKIMMDIDGVLADFVLGYTKVAAELGAKNCPWPTPVNQSWQFYDIEEPIRKAAFRETDKRGARFWANLEPLASREEFAILNQLADDHEVYYVTARYGAPAMEIVRATRSWLRAQGIAHPTVILSNKKGELGQVLGITHAVDDKAGNAVYLGYHSPSTKVYLLDRPYNRFPHDVLGGRVRRIIELKEFLADLLVDHLREITESK